MKLGRIFLTLFAIGCSSMPFMAQESDPVLMTVAGRDITRSEFEYAFNKNNVSDGQTAEEYLPMFVNFKLRVVRFVSSAISLISFKLN